MPNLPEAFDFIDELVLTSTNVDASMVSLLSYCSSMFPSPTWAKIREIDFEADVLVLSNWLEDLLKVEVPSNEIKAFWFGLFTHVNSEKIAECKLYVSGSVKDIDEPDWNVWDEKTYLPTNRYANSVVLSSLYSILTEEKMLGDWEYILCLGYAGLAVKSVWEATRLEGFRVAVGFDDGDYIILN